MFFIFAALMNLGMYWFSDKVVLKMYRAKIIDRHDAPELYDMVDRLRQWRAERPAACGRVVDLDEVGRQTPGRIAAEHPDLPVQLRNRMLRPG